MANVKNYGISGVSTSVELGKAGPTVDNAGGGNVDVRDSAGVYTHVSGKDGATDDNFVTKRQYDILDNILDKLVPEAPPNFATGAISESGYTTGTSPLLASGAIPDNTNGGTIPVTSAGDSVSAYRGTSAIVDSNTLTNQGPGDTGTVAIVVNGTQGTTLTFTSSTGQTINSGGLQVFNNGDYPADTPGFWQDFDIKVNDAAVTTGWNRYQLTHTAPGTSDTNDFYVLRDNMTGSPAIGGTPALTENAPGTLVYSSGIAHYQNDAVLEISGVTMTNLSGYTYADTSPMQINDNQSDDDSIIASNINKSYSDVGVSTPIAAGTTSAQSLNAVTFSPNDSNNHGTCPDVRFRLRNANGFSSYNTFTGNDVNYMVGTTSSRVDEDNIPMTGLSSSDRVFLGSSFTGNTPAGPLPAAPSAWVGTQDLTAAGYAHEAVVRGGIIRRDQTNYSTGGWLPQGLDYTGKDTSQYITFSWTQTAKSNFSITITGTYGGLWVGLPGVSDDNATSPEALGGAWWDAFQLYNGAGVPGRAGDAPAGCANGSAATGSSGTVNITFGTESSTNSTNNRCIVRVRLDAGDEISRITFSG